MKKGYSAVELIFVVLLISVLAVGFLGFGRGFVTGNDFENTKNELFTALRQAQLNAMSGKENRRWGVIVTTTPRQIKLYAEGTANFDQIKTYPNSITITNFDVLFDKLTGTPSNSGTDITISDSSGSQIYEWNSLGAIQYVGGSGKPPPAQPFPS